MTDQYTTETHSRVLTAFFDTRAAAETAIRDLTAAGIPKEYISLVGGGGASATSATTAGDRGIWESLKEFFMPEEDRYAYAEGLRRGGYLVSVRSGEANYDRVMDILDRDGSIDMDEREASWRSEGWTGYRAGAAGAGAAAYGSASAASTATTTASRGVTAGQDEVIPVYEEQIRIGKRDVSHGRVRLRTYVVETPVTEQVSLHSERVEIERHPVDRAVSAADVAFKDRTIEAEEYAEEAIVQKDVRVKEEVGLRKVAEEKTHTVSDTVRRTEVEIEDERGTVSRDVGSRPAANPKLGTPKV